MYHYLSIFWLLLLSNVYETSSSFQPEVTTEQGIIRGLYSKTFGNRKIATFEGIPYAKPPVGKHRFKEPVPAGPWIGIYSATREPPQCLQRDFSQGRSVVGSEDCLYLNVYTPQLPGDTKKTKLLDVIAYIHGGAFFLGKSGMVGPNLVLERDVVLVTMNYRLGPLGFFSTGDHVVPGNNGLKDQVLALKWIQKNIAAFGGNPNSVTIGGGSAGGVSCHYLTLSPLSKGLFKGAICVSGVALNPWAVVEDSKEKGMVIAKELGCPTNSSQLMIECLRNRPAEHIVDLSKLFVYWGQLTPLVSFGPVVEPSGPTAFISDSPVTVLKEKKGSDVPLLLIYAKDEGLCGGGEIIGNTGRFEELLNRWDELIPYVLFYNATAPSEKRLDIGRKAKSFYKVDDSPEGIRNMVKMIGDRMFVSGISKVAKIGGPIYSSPIYIYRYSYRGNRSLTEMFNITEDVGVSHGDDMLYTFGFNNINYIETESDAKVSKNMLDLWTSFASNGMLQDGKPTNKDGSKIVFTDIRGPDAFQLTEVDQLGEESFWDSLGLIENVKLKVGNHVDL